MIVIIYYSNVIYFHEVDKKLPRFAGYMSSLLDSTKKASTPSAPSGSTFPRANSFFRMSGIPKVPFMFNLRSTTPHLSCQIKQNNMLVTKKMHVSTVNHYRLGQIQNWPEPPFCMHRLRNEVPENPGGGTFQGSGKTLLKKKMGRRHFFHLEKKSPIFHNSKFMAMAKKQKSARDDISLGCHLGTSHLVVSCRSRPWGGFPTSETVQSMFKTKSFRPNDADDLCIKRNSRTQTPASWNQV